MKLWRMVLVIGLVVGAGTLATGCEKDEPPSAGDAIRQLGDDFEDAADDFGDAVDDAAEEIDDAAEKLEEDLEGDNP